MILVSKLNFQLPSLTNKVDLLLSDDDDSTLDNTVKASREIENRQQSTTLALTLSIVHGLIIYLIVSVLGDATKCLHAQRIEIYIISIHKTNLLYDTQLHYYNRDHLRSRNRCISVLFEHDGQKLDKLNHRWYYSDKRNEFKWHLEAQRYFRLDLQSTLVYTFYIQGINRAKQPY